MFSVSHIIIATLGLCCTILISTSSSLYAKEPPNTSYVSLQSTEDGGVIALACSKEASTTHKDWSSCFPMFWDQDHNPLIFYNQHTADKTLFTASASTVSLPLLAAATFSSSLSLNNKKLFAQAMILMIGAVIAWDSMLSLSEIIKDLLGEDPEEFYRGVGGVGVPEFDEVPMTKEEKYRELVKRLRAQKKALNSSEGTTKENTKSSEETAHSFSISSFFDYQEVWHYLTKNAQVSGSLSLLCFSSSHCLPSSY